MVSLQQAIEQSPKDFALLKQADGRIVFGQGPFKEVAEAPRSGTAFYVNDFALSDPKPWKIPAKVIDVAEVDRSASEHDLEVDWQDLTPEEFSKIFAEINETILKGEIEKSVPVAAEKGIVRKGNIKSLLELLGGKGDAFYPYAWVQGDDGFCGETPEVLFNVRKGRLTTMALAGTARADERAVFAFDEKEIREHEFVAQTLVSKLSDIGMVTKCERSILDLGSLVHFHTPIEVFLYGDKNIDLLMKRLHPTPALGPLPRTEETMQKLIEWRQRLDSPDYFGAPFGVLDDGVFHAVVTIRGVYWQGESISVPSGCGVIEASRLVNEWRELALKRNAVKRSFNLD